MFCILNVNLILHPISHSHGPKNILKEKRQSSELTIKLLFLHVIAAVFQIRIGLNADPDPGIYLNADLDSGFWTLKTEII